MKKFLTDLRGVSAIEYGLLASGIAVALITVVNGLGTQLAAKFTAILTAL
jgi:pilus assembly protein Flp/PilA